MLREEMVVGRAHAYRPPGQDSRRPVKVRVLLPPKKGQVKVVHLDGADAGFEEWVRSRNLLCLWKERQAFLRDEERWGRLREASLEARDFVEEEAISNVLTATGEESGFILTWRLDPVKARRLWDRAGLTGNPAREPYAFVDRHGVLCLPYMAALKFAKAFAAAEPETCQLYVREWEDKLRTEGYQPGRRYAHGTLRSFEPGFALVRAWSAKPMTDYLEEEVQRLRGVAWQAIAALRAAGQTRKATLLQRQLDGQ